MVLPGSHARRAMTLPRRYTTCAGTELSRTTASSGEAVYAARRMDNGPSPQSLGAKTSSAVGAKGLEITQKTR